MNTIFLALSTGELVGVIILCSLFLTTIVHEIYKKFAK